MTCSPLPTGVQFSAHVPKNSSYLLVINQLHNKTFPNINYLPAIPFVINVLCSYFYTDKYIYIADFSCIRVYDIERQLVATLTGACGRIEDPLTTTLIPPLFTSHLKLTVSARHVYVLEGEIIYRVDRETGVTTTLTTGRHLTGGFPSSLGKR